MRDANYNPTELTARRAAELWKRMLRQPKFDNGDTGPSGGLAVALVSMIRTNTTNELLEAFGCKLVERILSFERRQAVIHDAKGHKGRIVPFPEILHDQVKLQIESMRVLWKHDVADGLNGVSLPYAYGRKHPAARKLFAWYYLFSADEYSKCPRSGMLLRHHQDSGHVGRQIKHAADACGFAKHVTSHCLRHSYATHSIENGVPIHVVQAIMGHANIETTQRYLHVAKDGITSAKSPLEQLERKSPPLETILRNPPTPQESPRLRIFAG